MYQYKVKLYQYITYRDIVACFNQIIVHCGQPKRYMMPLKEKKRHLFLLYRNNIEQFLDSTSY